MYQVSRVSTNGHVKKPVRTFNSYDEAHDYCDSHDWEYSDLSGTEWELEIDEI